MTRKSHFDIVLPTSVLYKGFVDPGGSTVQGSLIFTPASNVKVKKIHLKFEGRHVASTATDFYRSEETFFQRVWMFFSSERGELFEAGKQVSRDFTLVLPGNLPESIKADYGSIEYKFKAHVETSFLSGNLKAERNLYIRRHTPAFVDERYITETADVWKQAVSYYLSIPSFEVSPGDEFPLNFQYRVLKESVRVLLVACILKEHVRYTSPKDPDEIVRDHEKSLDATFAWCQEDPTGEGKRTVNVKIPSSVETFDSRNPRIEVYHRLHIRIDIDWHGQLVNHQIDLPIVIVPQVEGIADQLPEYSTLPPPPTYTELLPPTEPEIFPPTPPAHQHSITA
ncbi:hypothetical protein K493DRAFT_300445 [Basidiobolus meristosporus CBS 931.73]|uniref:Arrestin C-terminal-like domain-containing protein n=1 Tax=Basidiobolus meristosporus CBS 931.73 TaxID=1314790 RepID=A0A1Y1YHG7_9FUNG|nr:hypothetical protein K493DRAFT_300445 [Basidiobolus meristosporus CBS 931.73]|eukprot:ORX97419.1 hypothetical protein K493DRAFT_300445 [Basidiobolus meristosporus CBS 931.73]